MRRACVLLILMFGVLWLFAGCGGGGGDTPQSSPVTLTPGTVEGQQYAGSYWPLDVGRWWHLEVNGDVTVTANGRRQTIDIDTMVEVDITREVDITLDTGTVQASEYRSGDIGGGVSPNSAPAVVETAQEEPALFKVLRTMALKYIESAGPDVQLAQAQDGGAQGVPDLQYYARVNDARIEKVAVGYSYLYSPPEPLTSPRAYLPVPLVAAMPHSVEWDRFFGFGHQQGDEIFQDLEELGLSGQIRYYLGVLGRESVQTPAGTFSAVKVYQRVALNASGADGSSADGTAQIWLWLAEGVGVVAERWEMDMNASHPQEGSGTVTLNLDGKLTNYGNDLAPPESAPNPVTNLTVNSLQTSIQLNWDPPIGTSLNVLRYEIWRSVDGTGFVLVADDVGAEEDGYIDTNTLSGQHVYQYRVRVVYTNSEVSADKYSTAIIFIPADEDRDQPPAPPEGGGDDGDVVPPAPPHY